MPQSTSIPDLLIEQLALGEGHGPTIETVAERFRIPVDEMRQRIAELKASNQVILDAYPAKQVRAQLETRLANSQRPTWRRSVYLGLLASTATAALLVWVWQPVVDTRSEQAPLGQPPIDQWIVRSKGTSKLFVYRQSDHGAAERLESGGRADAGDVVQLAYSVSNAQYGVVLSIDGAGHVTLHFPSNQRESTALATKPTILPYSFRLDAAPGFERFVFITSDHPLDVNQVLEAARETAGSSDGPLRLSRGRVADEVLLNKNKPSRR